MQIELIWLIFMILGQANQFALFNRRPNHCTSQTDQSGQAAQATDCP
jgi:hypothetical protein